jgi:hypothetical protein
MTALERLRSVLTQEGIPLSTVLAAGPVADPGPAYGALAAAGPRAAADPAEYDLLVEAVYEGYLLHYATSRLLADADPDFALLAGDRLYALGLERLVALGDLEAVRELADVIALCALLHSRGEGERCEAVWVAGVRAVASGASAEHERVKSLLRAADPAAGPALEALTEHAGFP